MADYLGIDRGRIHVVPLGIDCEGFGPSADEPQPFTIGYLARISPEKGLRFLCDAYQVLRARENIPPSRLWAAGYLPPEQKAFLADIQNDLDSKMLGDQFQYHGELDRQEKQNFLRNLSVFSVPETYADPKGLFLLEAMASGIPIVQPRRGAFSELIENTGGGILVEPDDPAALAQGFWDLWNDPTKRKELGARGAQAVRTQYSAAKMAENALAVYRTLLKPQTRPPAYPPGSRGSHA